MLLHLAQFGSTMEEGQIVRWLRSVGDAVKAGEPIAEIMTDKATVEVEAPADGVLAALLAAVDDTVPVGMAIADITVAGESPGQSRLPADPPAPPKAVSPRARRRADELGVDLAAIAGGSGPGGRVTSADVEAAALATPRRRVTPVAARMAADLGVDLSGLDLGLPGSRVSRGDVERAAAAPALSGADYRAEPLAGMRRIIADNVSRSVRTAPHVTLTTEVDALALVRLRSALLDEVQNRWGVRLTLTDFVVRAAAIALLDHPRMNAALVDDELRYYSAANVGIAVAVEDGLVVPVVRNADQRSLGAIASESRALVDRVRGGTFTPDDLADGTFTVTNLGTYGIDSFNPIIVPPQAGILGVCRLREMPRVVDGNIEPRPVMNLCLSFDHRVIDGAPAAQFLQRVATLLGDPAAILL